MVKEAAGTANKDIKILLKNAFVSLLLCSWAIVSQERRRKPEEDWHEKAAWNNKNRNIEMRDPKTNLEPQIAKQSHTEHAHKIQTKRRSRQARL